MSVVLLKSKSYGQFCPIARAAEVVAERWTPLILRELLFGATTFSELRKGIPLISPTTLSKRLAELQHAGIIAKDSDSGKYSLTTAGAALETLVMELGNWGLRFITDELRDDELDPLLLMWDIRRGLKLDELRRFGTDLVVHFAFRDAAPRKKYWWIIVKTREVDLCLKNPGLEPDLQIRTDLRTLTELWMGKRDYPRRMASQHFKVEGRSDMGRSLSKWLGTGVFGTIAMQTKEPR